MCVLEELSSRGHDLHRLINEYPISTVRALASATAWNKKVEMYLHAQSTTAAVMHSLDNAFNKGKGKVLPKFHDALLKPKKKSKDIDHAQDMLSNVFGGPRTK